MCVANKQTDAKGGVVLLLYLSFLPFLGHVMHKHYVSSYCSQGVL